MKKVEKIKTPTKKPFLKDIVLSYKIPQLVKILWVDAVSCGDVNWIDKEKAKEHAKEALPYMITVGFVLFSDDKQVAVTNTIGPNETAQINKIPRLMIISMEALS